MGSSLIVLFSRVVFGNVVAGKQGIGDGWEEDCAVDDFCFLSGKCALFVHLLESFEALNNACISALALLSILVWTPRCLNPLLNLVGLSIALVPSRLVR